MEKKRYKKRGEYEKYQEACDKEGEINMIIKLTSYGACSEVTGSLHMLSFGNMNGDNEELKILLDAGAYQGLEAQELNSYLPHSIDPMSIKYILISHAHYDHLGRLPMLVRRGFSGKIICTPVTRDLAFIVLDDMLKIQKGKQQEKDSENLNGKDDGSNINDIEKDRDLGLLFSEKDIERTKQLFVPITQDFGEWESDDGKLVVEFVNSEHIIGGASILIKKPIILLYTGDLGGGRSSLHGIPSPAGIGNVDYLMIESTYGNREIGKSDALSLQKAIEDVKESGGRLLIPVLAVDRAEELLYIIKELGIKEKVYFDTPLGLEVLDVYTRNRYQLSKIAKRLEQHGEYQDSIHYLAHGMAKTVEKNEVDFKTIFKPYGFEKVPSNKKSMEIAAAKFPCIIIGSSGMLEGGRIMKYLPGILESEKNIVLFTSYQGEGTLGRRLIDGDREINVGYSIKNKDGEIENVTRKVNVNCSIRKIYGLSAHADCNDLLTYIDRFKILPKKIFVVHGETDASENLKSEIEKRFRIETIVSQFDVSYELSESVSRNVIVTKDATNIDVLKESGILNFVNYAGRMLAPFAGWILDHGHNYTLISQENVQKMLSDSMNSMQAKLLPEDIDSRCGMGEEIEGTESIVEAQNYVNTLVEAFGLRWISKGLIKQLKEGIEKGKSEYLHIIDNKLKNDVLIQRNAEFDNNRSEINATIGGVLRKGTKLNIKLLKESIDRVHEKLREK